MYYNYKNTIIKLYQDILISNDVLIYLFNIIFCFICDYKQIDIFLQIEKITS